MSQKMQRLLQLVMNKQSISMLEACVAETSPPSSAMQNLESIDLQALGSQCLLAKCVTFKYVTLNVFKSCHGLGDLQYSELSCPAENYRAGGGQQ